MISFKIKVDDKDIYKKMKKLRGRVKVGFFSGEQYPDGTPVALVAAKNEFGGGKVPPRPFMRTCVEKRKKNWRKYVQNYIGTELDAQATLSGLATDLMVDDLKDYIRIWTNPPNAPSTIKKKGFNDPLIETGRMLDSVDWEYESK